ncbi:MAG: hypothetical protein FJY95_23470, partial [Candidatus Handelsmanbacteria bacterium]|nr:hypothetical protein [Candidatus Handelsmanbacteria bacterium]
MPNTSQGMTLLTNAFVARVQAELRTLEQAPIGRKKRVTSRSITDEIKALKGTDNDIIWMACAVVHAKIQIAGQKRLRSDEKQAKKRAKGQGAPNALSRIPKTAMDLMDREKRDDEMAKVVIYGLKASSEYRRLKGQVDREFGVKAKHTKLPSKTLRATASLLCDRFKQITG